MLKRLGRIEKLIEGLILKCKGKRLTKGLYVRVKGRKSCALKLD